jgi:nucleoside-diphosphate-sugar epimerase
MKILVAGGAGFIGSHLSARLLKDNHEVICADNLLTGSKKNIESLLENSAFSFLNHDVTNALPDTISADAIFHLASPASPNHHSRLSYHALPMETMMANSLGTLELLKFAEKNNATFLFASTSEVYGDPLVHPQQEEYRGNTSSTGPRSIYDEAKRFGETLTAYYGREKKVNVRIARIFNTYGPNMLPEDKRMIVSFIMEGLQNKPIPIFGDGTQTRSLCYVDDMVEGLMRFMFYPNLGGQIINLGSPDEYTVLEYAERVKKLLSSTSEIVLSEELPVDDPKQRRADITKAKRLLNWVPKISLDEGLTKLIDYLRKLKA